MKTDSFMCACVVCVFLQFLVGVWRNGQGWKMIEDGDRLCLGLSGGKDSMTLLHVLLDLKKRAPIK